MMMYVDVDVDVDVDASRESATIRSVVGPRDGCLRIRAAVRAR